MAAHSRMCFQSRETRQQPRAKTSQRDATRHLSLGNTGRKASRFCSGGNLRLHDLSKEDNSHPSYSPSSPHVGALKRCTKSKASRTFSIHRHVHMGNRWLHCSVRTREPYGNTELDGFSGVQLFAAPCIAYNQPFLAEGFCKLKVYLAWKQKNQKHKKLNYNKKVLMYVTLNAGKLS